MLSVETPPVPFVSDDDRLTIDDLLYDDDGITHVTARYGFQEKPDVLAILRLAQEQGVGFPIEIDDASYFLSTIDIVPNDAPGMTRWRKRVFCALARLAADPIEYFVLPRDRTVLMGRTSTSDFPPRFTSHPTFSSLSPRSHLHLSQPPLSHSRTATSPHPLHSFLTPHRHQHRPAFPLEMATSV